MLIENASRMKISDQVNITVIIPVFNCKRYLREAVNSVIEQPYANISVVLINDGSTDGSGELCDKLALESNRIIVIHQNNAGVSAARNAGIEYVLSRPDNIASKQYLAFLDADDCWTKNFFTNDTVSALPEAAIIRFLSVNCNSDMRKCGRSIDTVEGIYAGGAAFVHKCLSSHFGAALYERKLLFDNNIRFITGLKHSEDVLFLRTCVYKANFVAMYNRVLYLYRNNPTSCVHTNTAHGFAYFEAMFQAYLEYDFDGAGFVSWYFVDAIEDHFKFGGTLHEARKWITEHPLYVDIAKEHGSNRVKGVLTALEVSPHLYAMKFRAAGFAFNCARKIVHTMPFSMICDWLRYRNRILNF